ncbi:hypothetical protein QBC39DRAFT_410544 [Podospora conica]|nr:hypothetical protein QBC39DRAFT_410544 [Schizothecium conicum]
MHTDDNAPQASPHPPQALRPPVALDADGWSNKKRPTHDDFVPLYPRPTAGQTALTAQAPRRRHQRSTRTRTRTQETRRKADQENPNSPLSPAQAQAQPTVDHPPSPQGQPGLRNLHPEQSERRKRNETPTKGSNLPPPSTPPPPPFMPLPPHRVQTRTGSPGLRDESPPPPSSKQATLTLVNVKHHCERERDEIGDGWTRSSVRTCGVHAGPVGVHWWSLSTEQDDPHRRLYSPWSISTSLRYRDPISPLINSTQ